MNKKMQKLTAIITVCIIAVCIVAVVFFQSTPLPSDDMYSVNVYFINASTNKLVTEQRKIKKSTEMEMVGNLYQLYLEGPETAGLSNGIDNIEIVDWAMDWQVKQASSLQGEKTVELAFTSEYSELPPAKELLLRSALVYTFTELDWIDNVTIYAGNYRLTQLNGEVIEPMNKDNVLVNTLITQEKVVKRWVDLYFANSDLTGLVAERRRIAIPSDMDEGQVILEELMKGPDSSNLVSMIPSGTVINDVNTTVEGVCYVDLNGTFERKLMPDTPARKLAIYSIVNSLTGLSKGNIRKVQFLINAEKAADKNNTVDLSQTFETNQDLIIKPEIEME